MHLVTMTLILIVRLIECLPLRQKLQLIIKAQIFLLKSITNEVSQFDCDLT